jgi:hypothetical protein
MRAKRGLKEETVKRIAIGCDPNAAQLGKLLKNPNGVQITKKAASTTDPFVDPFEIQIKPFLALLQCYRVLTVVDDQIQTVVHRTTNIVLTLQSQILGFGN